MSDRPSLDRCPRCGHDHGRENWPLCLCDCYRVADDQRTGQADTAPRAHIDAVAQVLYDAIPDPDIARWDDLDGFARSIYRTQALAIVRSTDPAVHAALIDALTRHGVLTEDVRREFVHVGGRIPPGRRLVTAWIEMTSDEALTLLRERLTGDKP